MMNEAPIVIIGGGLSGIMAALTIKETSKDHVLIVDKGRSVGGRLATRRVGEGKVDHGAQFFTVRTSILQSYVDDWLEKGWIKQWFGEKYPRYTSVNGMNTLAKNLASEVKVKLNTKIACLEKSEGGYMLTTDSAEKIAASGVILTAPVPQAKELLEKSSIEFERATAQKLASVTFNPAFVAILELAKETTLPNTGHIDHDLPQEIERIVDHRKKGISATNTISVYMKGSWSLKNLESDDKSVLRGIIQLIEGYINRDSIISSVLKKWRYAEATQTIKEPYLSIQTDPPLFIAGDPFLHTDDQAGRTRFESAFLSGIAAGKEIKKFF